MCARGCSGRQRAAPGRGRGRGAARGALGAIRTYVRARTRTYAVEVPDPRPRLNFLAGEAIPALIYAGGAKQSPEF